MHDWAVPVLVSLLALGGIFGAAQMMPAGPPPSPLVPVFAAAVVDPDAPGTLLAVRAVPSDAAWSTLLPVPAAGPIVAEGGALANATLAAPGPRFGQGGMQSAALTVYAFTAKGRLLASNAPPAAMARFPLDGDFQALPPAILYLGEGPPPAGTLALPHPLLGLAPSLREALAGQPVGGVVVLRVGEGPVVELAGPVTVALRVDRLVATA
jgi:hypothetical protein